MKQLELYCVVITGIIASYLIVAGAVFNHFQKFSTRHRRRAGLQQMNLILFRPYSDVSISLIHIQLFISSLDFVYKVGDFGKGHRRGIRSYKCGALYQEK